MKDLHGKVAVITGGASGIGLAMAEAFGAEGMRLVIADVEPGRLDGAVAGLRAKGFEAIGVMTNVARFTEVEALAAATLAAFGKVHGVCLSITHILADFHVIPSPIYPVKNLAPVGH